MLPAPDGPFAVQELFADAFVVLVPTDSALARSGRALSLSELAELPLVVANGCRYTSHLETQMRERGFEPDVVHRSDDNGTVQGLVAAGAGVAVVPELVAHSGGAPVTVLGIDEPLPPRRIALSWRDDRHLPAVREQFAHEVVQICSELGLKAA
jgi:DNA-binding transcriptional LysR family regulator